ncbi:hypothetical protein B0T14DRAFT_588286 [Immersiella caudata]|uniref:Uncharacterized protein n=1 Tax=Immersiella caudata TaxID=314043 RepID=A0AA39WJ48_9PEZI|nr:hypothetical protein B0T14DRAFT_588286 [Immersiella caudata]
MIIGIAALCLVASIAWTMNDRPLTDWAPTNWATPISINAVISAITVISRAALAIPIIACISQLKWIYFKRPHKVSDMDVFDNASRGAMGSMQFLFKIPRNGAALGAFITLLAYLLGPFYQQVIRLEQRDVFVSGNETAAVFAFTHNYTTGSTVNGATSLAESIDTQMQGAMIAGIFGNNISSTFNCSSTCRWAGPITTLGFHSECRNITAQTLATKKCLSVVTGGKIEDSEVESHNCTLATPNGIRLFSDYSHTSQWTGFYLTGKIIPFPLVDAPPDQEGALSRHLIFPNLRISSPPGGELVGEGVQECTISVAAYNYTDIQSSGNDLRIGRREIFSSQLSVVDDLNIGDSPTANVTVTYSAPGIPDLVIKRLDLRAIAGFLEEFTDKVVQVGISPQQKFGLVWPQHEPSLTQPEGFLCGNGGADDAAHRPRSQSAGHDRKRRPDRCLCGGVVPNACSTHICHRRDALVAGLHYLALKGLDWGGSVEVFSAGVAIPPHSTLRQSCIEGSGVAL